MRQSTWATFIGITTRDATSARKKGGGKKKTRKVGKKTRKSSSSKKKDDSQMENASSNNTVIPDFHLFGGRDDLMFFGDSEELYANEKPR